MFSYDNNSLPEQIKLELQEAIEELIDDQEQYYLTDENNPFAEYINSFSYQESPISEIFDGLRDNDWSDENIDLVKQIKDEQGIKTIYKLFQQIGTLETYTRYAKSGICQIDMGEVEIFCDDILDKFQNKYKDIDFSNISNVTYLDLNGSGWSIDVKEEIFEDWIKQEIDSLEPVLGLVDPRQWVRNRFYNRLKENEK